MLVILHASSKIVIWNIKYVFLKSYCIFTDFGISYNLFYFQVLQKTWIFLCILNFCPTFSWFILGRSTNSFNLQRRTDLRTTVRNREQTAILVSLAPRTPSECQSITCQIGHAHWPSGCTDIGWIPTHMGKILASIGKIHTNSRNNHGWGLFVRNGGLWFDWIGRDGRDLFFCNVKKCSEKSVDQWS